MFSFVFGTGYSFDEGRFLVLLGEEGNENEKGVRWKRKGVG